MQKKQMIKRCPKLFCFYRKCFSFFLVFALSFFYSKVSETERIITKTDHAFIKVDEGALLYIENENNKQKEDITIYVVEGTVLKNISEKKNIHIVYINNNKVSNKVQKKENSQSDKSKQSSVNHLKTNQEVNVKCILNSHENICHVFKNNRDQLTVSTQNFPKINAVSYKKIHLLIGFFTNRTNLFPLYASGRPVSLNSDFHVRPPPHTAL